MRLTTILPDTVYVRFLKALYNKHSGCGTNTSKSSSLQGKKVEKRWATNTNTNLIYSNNSFGSCLIGIEIFCFPELEKNIGFCPKIS